jgi:hypothetical protein
MLVFSLTVSITTNDNTVGFLLNSWAGTMAQWLVRELFARGRIRIDPRGRPQMRVVWCWSEPTLNHLCVGKPLGLPPIGHGDQTSMRLVGGDSLRQIYCRLNSKHVIPVVETLGVAERNLGDPTCSCVSAPMKGAMSNVKCSWWSSTICYFYRS